MNLELLKAYALTLVGHRYDWGGDDPVSGFDCSGLACEIMRAAGVVAYNYRSNAQTLYSLLRTVGHPVLPQLGAVSFYGKSLSEITHVGFCIDEMLMIEAGGGDSSTIDDKHASLQNAFVRMRPVRFRRDFLLTIMPNYAAIKPAP